MSWTLGKADPLGSHEPRALLSLGQKSNHPVTPSVRTGEAGECQFGVFHTQEVPESTGSSGPPVGVSDLLSHNCIPNRLPMAPWAPLSVLA